MKVVLTLRVRELKNDRRRFVICRERVGIASAAFGPAVREDFDTGFQPVIP